MKNIILFDTSVGTLNHGDEIIMESFLENADDILEGNNVLRFPTHTPCFHFFQQVKRNPRFKYVQNADHKLICGTNLLSNKIYIPWHFWNINFFNSLCYKGSVLVGVGSSAFGEDDKLSFYSKMLFKSILSKKYIHSVRDERTKKIVEKICGVGRAINTGCPTLWKLTRDFCKGIPVKKADNVVFTLSDYSIDRKNDQRLLNILIKNYNKVYFWPQGTKDKAYFESLSGSEKVIVISPTVKAFSKLLSEGNLDYVGTRLHAGIYAMQHKVRSVILMVDNRATDMSATYNINAIKRDDNNLENILKQDIVTNINIDEEKIKAFKAQFL